jgi:hypothetical protein
VVVAPRVSSGVALALPEVPKGFFVKLVPAQLSAFSTSHLMMTLLPLPSLTAVGVVVNEEKTGAATEAEATRLSTGEMTVKEKTATITVTYKKVNITLKKFFIVISQ